MAKYVLPDLPYDYAALEPAISGQIMELHHDKHHQTYVTAANDTIDKLAAARESGDYGSIVGLQKTLAFNLAGHAMHTVFWPNLSPDGGDKPEGELAAAVDEYFGSFDKLRAHVTAAAMTIQGSGWAALSWDPLGSQLIVHQIYDHQANMSMSSAPLFVIDMWEHAFYLQYKNVKADYVKNIWSIVNWSDIGKRFESARAGGNGLLLP
jgi:Fe-Mn family superoxide dismutase